MQISFIKIKYHYFLTIPNKCWGTCPSILFLSGFPAKTRSTILTCSMCARCPTHFIHTRLIITIAIFKENYKLCTFSISKAIGSEFTKIRSKVLPIWLSGGSCVVKGSWQLCWQLRSQPGQRRWPKRNGIFCSSRLGVGREANNIKQ